jgi:glucose-1-phosphate cytidylyltransferase
LKAIILAGGLGTRIAEETSDKPKPMVLINGKPILWHIMNIYANQGVNDFYIATGYMGHVISNWSVSVPDSWRVTALDTGLDTQTGGRIQKCLNEINEDRVFATYGDGLGNVNLKKLLDFHLSAGRLATVTAVRPPARFGVLESENGLVTHFGEKSQADAGWINGGFFVLERNVSQFVSHLNEPFETGALPRLVQKSELAAYHHDGFWQPMDTLREKQVLEKLASAEKPVWLNHN